MTKEMTKSLPISKRMVYNSYLRVIAKDGSAGIDEQSIEQFNENLSDNLYKIWNRMTSGSYFPPPVRTVFIPKKQGGKRPLGIPTVSDRIAQGVVKDFLEPILEPLFHVSSFGYRPGRSAHDALAQCKHNCTHHSWVVDLDIKGFFDNISHEWMMKMLSHHTQEKWVLLYTERWLKAGIEQADGSIAARQKGTPQGGVLASRTHPQTLSFSGDFRLKGANFKFDYFIKGSIFMINGKSTKFGTCQAHQSGVCFTTEGETCSSDSGTFNGNVWSITNPGVSLYSASQREQRKTGYSGSFCGIYRQATTGTDQSDKEICEFQRHIDQQSGPYSAGRIFSKEGSWQKRRNNLKCHIPMTAYGSKSSLRFIVSLSQSTLLSPLNIPILN